MRLRYRFIAPLTVLLTTPFALPAASAEDVFAQAFTIPSEGVVCYARTYDAAHLKAHPRQKTVALEIDMVAANPDDRPNTAERFELGVGFQGRKGADWYTGNAICKTENGRMSCFLEGDGGDLKLTPLPDGSLKVETSRIAIEGGSDAAEAFFEIEAGKDDDSVFILPRANRALCDASTREFE